jgi:hypothetical protein
MNMRKLRTLGISFAAILGLMAFMAVGATANWLVLHPVTKTVVEPEVTLEIKKHSEHFALLVPALSLEILCAKVQQDAAAPVKLLAASTVAHGHVIFMECKTTIKGIESPGCKPTEPILAGGLFLIILHNGINWMLLEPLKGLPFTTLLFNPAKCALPEENEITGSLVFECGHLSPPNTWVRLDCKNHELTHLIREAPEALFPADGFRFGENGELLDGIVALSIAAPELYKDALWGGHV